MTKASTRPPRWAHSPRPPRPAACLASSDTQLAVAFGIAATQAAGLKSNFGTMCKPLHAGTASEHGLRAARLAAKGFTARGDSLECDQGFASSQSDHLNTDDALGEPPSGWHLRNNLFKYHAACYMTHAPIECAKEIRLKSNFPPERVKKIVLRLDAAADKVCNIPNPTTRARSQVLAAPDRRHGADRRQHREPRVLQRGDHAGPAHQGAARQGRRSTSGPSGRMRWPRWRSSSTTARRSRPAHDSGIPWSDVAKQRNALETKFDGLVTPVLGAAGAKRLHDAIDRIDTLADVGDLARASAKA